MTIIIIIITINIIITITITIIIIITTTSGTCPGAFSRHALSFWRFLFCLARAGKAGFAREASSRITIPLSPLRFGGGVILMWYKEKTYP